MTGSPLERFDRNHAHTFYKRERQDRVSPVFLYSPRAQFMNESLWKLGRRPGMNADAHTDYEYRSSISAKIMFASLVNNRASQIARRASKQTGSFSS